MPLEYKLTETRDVLNRMLARQGATVQVSDVRLTLQPTALATMNGESGVVGEAVRRAARVTVDRAKARVTSYGRVDTGFMRDSIHATFLGSNQYESRFRVASEATYSIYQHDGTNFIKPAPFLADALDMLRPEDFQGAG